MGAESSHQMSNVSISDKHLAERLRNDVVLFDARFSKSQKVSVFEDCCSSKENPFIGYTLDRPLARAIGNLKIYRHPFSIVKFLGATSDKQLITEFLQGSLEKNLKSQSEIQICLGLKNVLNALIFLVESAKVRHLNIDMGSIFVTESGAWKLNGLEHVFKSSDITKEFLEKSRPYRNQKNMHSDEGDGAGLEQFAFAILCENVIAKDSQIPFVQDFLTYCSTHLKHKNPSMRPHLSAIQLHNYFTHDFVIIHGFLNELALKTQPAKQEFFKALHEKLKQFDEDTIGSQLSELLLSRLVLLDQAAQFYFIPFLLKPKNLEDDEETTVDDGLLSTPAFVKFIVPKLKQVLRVLDVQIRLTLLEHFHLYVNVFTREELVDEILPQLLLGIKDTNDFLVTKTLLCLAELIPILGASQVIGKNRRKLFADGRPQQTEIWNNDQPRSITPVISASMDILLSSSPVDHVEISEYSTKNSKIFINGSLPEAADDGDTTENELEADGDIEWGWDQETTVELQESVASESAIIVEEKPLPTIPTSQDQTTSSQRSPTSQEMKDKLTTKSRIAADNIDELDIKNQKLTKLEEQKNEIDFFSDFDMAPTITQKSPTAIPTVKNYKETANESSRLQMMSLDVNENDGWGEDDWGNNEEAL